MNKKILGFILAIILLSNLATMTSFVNAQTNKSTNIDEKDLQKRLDTYYLMRFGLYSNITAISSSAKIFGNSKSAGFLYYGNFSVGMQQYFVQSSQTQSVSAKTFTTHADESISGSMTYSSTYDKSNQTTNKVTSTNLQFTMQTTNASGTYHFNVKYNSSVAADTSKLLSGSMQVEQNLIGQSGTYNINLTSELNNNVAVTIIQPDGTQLATNVAQTPPNQLPVAQLDGNVAVMDSSTTNGEWTADAYGNDKECHVDYQWGTPGYEWVSDIIAGAFSTFISAFFGGLSPFSVFTIAFVLSATTLVMAERGAFPATMDDYDLTIMYFEIAENIYTYNALLTGFPVLLKIPYEAEMGFFSNRYCFPNVNNGEPVDIGHYRYYDLFDTCEGHLYAWNAVFGSFLGGTNDSHDDIWPVDPPPICQVAVLAYDESTSSYVDNIPVAIDGDWIPSGLTVSIPAADRFFEADSDAFHYFSLGGYASYGNSALIPISEDTTVTACYYYIPTYTLTVNAWDCYNGLLCPNVYVDDNYVGTAPLSMQVTLGYHSVEVDSGTYDPWWYCYVGCYAVFVTGLDYNPDGMPIMSDTTVTAMYS